MNWSKLSVVTEVLGSVAIVATLVYLAVEIRQNTTVLQANSRDAVLASDVQFLNRIVDDPDIWFSYYKPHLTDVERVRLFHHLAAVTRIAERNWQQYRSGALDEGTWRSYQSGFFGTITAPQPRKWWEATGSNGQFDAEFRKYVDDRLSQGTRAPEVSGVFPFFD